MDDMLLTKEQKDYFYDDSNKRRNGLINPSKLWPDATVVYSIDSALKTPAVRSVLTAMFYIESVSCVKFVKRKKQHQNYVTFTNGNICRSSVGMQTGKQQININPEVCNIGNVVHGILHSLGFVHMHTISERDKFITINWSNIKKSAFINFKKRSSPTDMFNTPYDFFSILHYPTNAFAIDKKLPTIIAKTTNAQIGPGKCKYL